MRRCEWTGSVDYPVKQVSGALSLGLIFEQKRRLVFGDTRLTFVDCHVIAKTRKIYPWLTWTATKVKAFEPKAYTVKLQLSRRNLLADSEIPMTDSLYQGFVVPTQCTLAIGRVG